MITGLTVGGPQALADLARPSQREVAWLYDAALVAGGSLAIALCAQVAIGYPVPITGQTFGVVMVAALLGSRRGALCLLMYLVEGLAGLPVFAQGKAGFAAFLGPTGGYLVGFVFAAWLVGALSERTWDRRPVTTVAAMLLGNLVIYAFGLAWLLCLTRLLGQPLGAGLLAVGLYPFLVGDLLKIALAAALLPAGWRLIRYFRFEKTPRSRTMQ
jgi:biotin transport system substrate-specific component